jgi:glycosyltransferase involved in cell wall biosynthesis
MTKGERVIAVSDFIARHIRDNYSIDPRRLRVVPRGIDVTRFDPDRVSGARVVALAGRWRLPDGVPVVMLPGRLTRWKGQSVLIEAIAQLADIEVCCLLVGSHQGRTGYRRELHHTIARLGLEGRVFIVDTCDDMPAAYKLCDVVISASIEPEAFGRVISEGQAMGRPVIASNHGGAPEQLVAGRTGLLVPPGDPAALAGALRDALSLTSEERERVALEAIENVRANFSKDLMCTRTLALYSELTRADAYDEVEAVLCNEAVGRGRARP